MPIAWCYETQNNEKFCSPGFPFGCYVGKDGEQYGACVISVRCKLSYVVAEKSFHFLME